jgi:hypothetical protein
MIAFLARTSVRMLLFAAFLYGTFFIPLGPRTLYGHLSRIAGTAEAHELFGAVSGAAHDASRAVVARVEGIKSAARR